MGSSAPQIWPSLGPFSQSIRATSVKRTGHLCTSWKASSAPQIWPRVAVSNTWKNCGRLGSDLLIGTMRLQAWPCPAAFGPNFNNDDSQRFLTEDQVDHKQPCIVVHDLHK